MKTTKALALFISLITIFNLTGLASVLPVNAVGPLTSVSIIDPTIGTISPGSIEANVPTQLVAEPLDETGAPFIGAALSWSSSNPAVATIDQGGVVTGLSAGTSLFTVTAADGAISVNGTLNLTVYVAPGFPTATTTVQLAPLTADVYVGASQQFIATVLINNPGQPPIDITPMANVTWSSDNTNVGTINSNGLFTAVSAGSCIITATSDGISATATATVLEPTAAPILTGVSILNPSVVTITPGGVEAGTNTQITANAIDQFGAPYVGANLTWSSSDTNVATVGANGLLTAVYPGNFTLTVSATDGGITVEATLNLTVIAPPSDGVVAAINMSQTSINLTVGQGWGITAQAVDRYGTPIGTFPTQTYTWATSNSAIATITPYPDNSSAFVSAKSAGTATITASVGGINGTVQIIVANKPACVASISVSPVSASIIMGNTQQLTATVIDQYGATMATPPTVYWLNSAPGVASINSNGLVTGLTPGQAGITTMANGCFGVVYGNGASITVLPIPGTFGITASAGLNGAISPSGYTSVISGGSQSYTITPNAGYNVANVLVDGVSVATTTSYAFTNVAANHTIAATFSAIPLATFNIISTAGANGVISPSGTSTVTIGNNQAYTITPNANYSVADVLVDGVSVGAVTAYAFTNVQAPHAISATFTPIPVVLGNLVPGWNLIGWTAVPTTADAFALANGVDVVTRYNNATQSWSSHIVGFPVNNFTINSGDGIFVHKL